MISKIHKFLINPGLGPMLIKATLGSAGLRIGGMFFGFLVGAQLARGLGVEGYGIYGLAMSIIALLSVLTEFGLPQLLTREVASAEVRKDWGHIRGVLEWSGRTVLFISLGIFCFTIIWFFASGKQPTEPLPVALIAGLLLVPFVAQGKLRCAVLRGLRHIVKSQLPETLLRPASFSLLLFLTSFLVPLVPALAMSLGVTAAVISLIFSAAMLRSVLPQEIKNAKAFTESRGWWTSALPMALTEGMRVFQAHLSILMLGFLSSVETVGLFRVATSMSVLIAFPLTLFTMVSAPVIARLHTQHDHRRLQRLLGWLALGMTGSSLLLTLPFIFAGEPLLGMIFGKDFAASNPVLLILCFSTVLSGFFGNNAVLLNMTGHQVRVMRASWISLAILVFTCPLLIAVMGSLGAAIAAAFSMLVWNTVMWRDGIRLLKLDASLLSLIKLNVRRL